ncbi:splicing factor 3B subunit 6-like [Penaeus monodon]|uniref:splicing factor 3B subunit 6-like n=1 Tax=Penaeus monodon TaxID=6687 RepID=UPI0018A7A9D7|nr:splicing factor 3B subunit 6-like [Penaeus monodon]
MANTPETPGTAFVVYEDIFDAKNACDHLSGFNVCGRYLVVLYYQSNKAFKKWMLRRSKQKLDRVKTKYNINTEEKKKLNINIYIIIFISLL